MCLRQYTDGRFLKIEQLREGSFTRYQNVHYGRKGDYGFYGLVIMIVVLNCNQKLPIETENVKCNFFLLSYFKFTLIHSVALIFAALLKIISCSAKMMSLSQQNFEVMKRVTESPFACQFIFLYFPNQNLI